jgi:hypothetical protein
VSRKAAFNKKYCKGWDCYANKGVQMVTVRIKGIPFDLPVYNTHLQASADHDAIRKLQMNQTLQFMKPTLTAGEPVIFAGDFNTNPSRESFQYWKDISNMKNVGETCLASAKCEVAQRTDRAWVVEKSKDQHFSKNGKAKSNSGSSTVYNVRFAPFYALRNFTEVYPDGKMLSDHMGYEVGYQIIW